MTAGSPATYRTSALARLAAAVPLPLAVFAAALVVLVLRQPESIFRAEFFAEDGKVFYMGALAGPASLVSIYNGYLHLLPRLVSMAAWLVPPYWAPLVMNAAALATTAAVAAYLASDRMADAVPDRRMRLAIAAGFLLLPASDQLSWHVLYVQWSLAFFLVARLVARSGPPFVDHLAVAIAALTSPYAIVLAPLYLIRRLGTTAAIVCGCAAVQLALAVTHPRSPGPLGLDFDTVRVLALRIVAEPFIGMYRTGRLAQFGVPIPIGALFVVGVLTLLALAATALTRRQAAFLGYVFAAAAAAAAMGNNGSMAALLYGDAGTRYYILTSAMLGVVLLLAFVGRSRVARIAAAPLIVMMVVAIARDARVVPPPDLDWADRSACIGGTVACSVPVAPDADWTVNWSPPP